MAVALQSLRVTTDNDASGYARGAAVKVAADQQMIDSDRKMNSSLAQAQAAMDRAIPGFNALAKGLLQGYSAGQTFEAQVRRIGNSVDQGLGLDKANLLLEALYRKFNLVADASVLARQGFVSIVPAVNDLNKAVATYEEQVRRADLVTKAFTDSQKLLAAQSANQNSINSQLGVGAGSGGSAQASADAFLADVGGLAGIAKAKAKQISDAFTEELQTRLIAGTAKSARESASVFEASFSQLDEIAAAKAKQAGANFQISLNESMIAGAAKSARDSASVFDAALSQLDDIAAMRAQQAGQNFQTSLTQAMIAGTAKSARDSASVFEAELSRLDLIATQKAQQAGQNFQNSLNQAMGIGTTAKSARESASAFQALFAAEELAAKGAADLRAQINPLEAEMGRLGKQMAVYRQMQKDQIISSTELEKAHALAAKRLSDVDMSLRKGATAGRVMSGEMANLGYQVNDVITGLALGQSPFMILAQQGGQFYQIFSHSKSSVLDFVKAAGSGLANFLTAGRLAFGGVAISIGAAMLALNSYLGAQQKVAMGLTGAGRASGATVGGIGNIANQGSSAFGLSISEARELATALAATGKVANDNILPIVKMGKDIEHAFGVNATEATKMLADAFAEPARGAQTLNDRLGFLDAGTKRNIENLVAQNRVWEAQKVLLAGVKSGLEGVDEAVASSTKFWTLLGNGISNAWENLGEYVARGLGVGQPLEARLSKARQELEMLKAGLAVMPSLSDLPLPPTAEPDNAGAIAAKTAEIEKMTAALQKQATAAAVAQAAQRSFLQESIVRSLQPDIAALEKLNNNFAVLTELMKSLGSDEAAGARLAALGLTIKQIADALAVAGEKVKAFKTDFEATVASAKISLDAITAFSPGQKGDIAYRQSILANKNADLSGPEKETQAQMAAAIAIKQVTTALSEQGRVRELTARQSIASVQLDIDMLGKSIGQQAEMRANLQARQALEQQASQNGTAFDNAEYERLKKINAEYGKRVQAAAQEAFEGQVKFQKDTILLGNESIEIAQKLAFKYGNDIPAALASAEAAQLRLLNVQRDTVDAFKEVGKAIFTAFLSGKNVMDAMVGALDRVAAKLADSAFENILSGNPAQMGIGAVQAAASFAISMFTGDQKAKEKEKKRLEEAKKAWEGMADEVAAFNRAAAGFDLGPMTQAIESLYNTQATLANAANDARDFAGRDRVQENFNKGVARIVEEFVNANAALTPLEESIKRVNDEARGLTEKMTEYKWGEGPRIEESRLRQIAALQAEFFRTTEEGLRSEINSARGVGYVNSIADALKKFSDLAAQGVNSGLLRDWLSTVAQDVINSAGLVGDAFQSLIAGFPTLAGLVTEASAAIARSAAEIAAVRQNYQDQLFNLLQDQTTLAGQLAVFDRKAAQDRAAEAAAGGQALVDLENLQAAQRFDIVKKFNDQQLEAARQAAEQFKSFLTQLTNTIQTYLDGLTGGSGSPLSPQARLAAAQASYNAQLALAQGGDQTAAGNITQYASNLLDAAKAFYASTTGFQDIFAQVQSQLGALPAQISSTQQIVNAITTQTSALQAAFATGSASAIAAALSGYFDQLDSNLDDNISFTEMQAALGSSFSSGTWANILSTLDTDGDGQISRLEAIKGFTNSTSSQLTTANAQLYYLADINFKLSNLATMAGSLNLIHNDLIDANSKLLTLTVHAANISTHASNIFVTLVNRVMAALNTQSSAWGVQTHTPLPSYALGTNFHPGGLARINERGGEILDLPRGARVYPHDVSKRIADNEASSASETRALRQQVAQLERVIREGLRDVVEMTGAVGEDLGEKLDLGNSHYDEVVKRARR